MCLTIFCLCHFSNDETVNFRQFINVLARFRPTKVKTNKNKLNTREEKLKCKLIWNAVNLNTTLCIDIYIYV